LLEEGRLIIPARVAREFANNRAKKLGELFQRLTNQQSKQHSVQQESYPLLENIDEYTKLQEEAKNIALMVKDYQKTLASVIAKVESWAWNDPISLLYQELFTPNVVVECKKGTEELRKAHIERFALKIPPGYKDEGGKDDDGIGDLLIWQTILEIAADQKHSVIFVTGEKKADWWHNSNGRQLYPRYELVDEFRRASGGESFHIITFSRLLEMFGASSTAVNEVRVEETASSAPITRAGPGDISVIALQAVVDWLTARSFIVQRAPDDSGFDLLASNDDSMNFVRVMYQTGGSYDRSQLAVASQNTANGRHHNATLVAVCASQAVAKQTLEHLVRSGPRHPFVVGILTPQMTFESRWGLGPLGSFP